MFFFQILYSSLMSFSSTSSAISLSATELLELLFLPLLISRLISPALELCGEDYRGEELRSILKLRTIRYLLLACFLEAQSR